MASERKCPGCSGRLLKVDSQKSGFTYECSRCGGLVATHMYLGDSYSLVTPRFAAEGTYAEDEVRYFDLSGLSSKGEYRRHGWYVPRLRLLTQVG